MEDMDWIDLAQEMYRWKALVKTVIKLQFPSSAGSSYLAENRLASQEGLYSME
jgi:hypothetical protein